MARRSLAYSTHGKPPTTTRPFSGLFEARGDPTVSQFFSVEGPLSQINAL
jgi:hypothetical protein